MASSAVALVVGQYGRLLCFSATGLTLRTLLQLFEVLLKLKIFLINNFKVRTSTYIRRLLPRTLIIQCSLNYATAISTDIPARHFRDNRPDE